MTPTIANLSGFETFTSVSPTALSRYCTVTFCKTLTTTLRFLVHNLTKSNPHILMSSVVKFLWTNIKLISRETSFKYPRTDCYAIQFSLISIQNNTHYVAWVTFTTIDQRYRDSHVITRITSNLFKSTG